MSSTEKTLVAIIGVGLIGKEVVSQILAIPPDRNTFKIVYLASSRHALYAPTILPDDWIRALNTSRENPNLQGLAAYLKTLVVQGHYKQAVIVDNTSSEDVAKMYPAWLRAGLNVVTPNKKAFSGDRATWDAILTAANGEDAGRFFNESTVGAGLPVINTLKEMLGSGDRVRKIEGVFSGTLSYVFNEWSPAASNTHRPTFSEVVRTARDRGFTEPHPAEDLKGEDVARKLTILARIVSSFSAGEYQRNRQELQSFREVRVQSLIPEALEQCTTGDEFLEGLSTYDSQLDAVRRDAENEGMVLRFVGVIDLQQGFVKAGLEK